MNWTRTHRHQNENKPKPKTETSRGWVTGRWNDGECCVQYLARNNSGYCWVRSLDKHNRIVFDANLRRDITRSNINKLIASPTFTCKVFKVVEYSQGYSGWSRNLKCYKLTNHNHWHKLEALMKN